LRAVDKVGTLYEIESHMFRDTSILALRRDSRGAGNL